jgi:hypothetical protein
MEVQEIRLEKVLDAKEALDILARATNRASSTTPAPRRLRFAIPLELPAAVQRALDEHQLEVTADELEINGECFLQVSCFLLLLFFKENANREWWRMAERLLELLLPLSE